MTRMHFVATAMCFVGGIFASTETAFCQSPAPAEKATRSPGQRLLDSAAREQKFTFLVFYKTDTPAVRAMAKVAQEGAEKRKDKACAGNVNVSDPAEKALVDQFDLSRSPMPLTLVVAPNLAVTGIFPKDLTDSQLDEALVTPTMTRCMKSLQEGKLVFVCVQAAEKDAPPPVVRQMQLEPDFSSRIVVVSMSLRDPAEGRFLQQMQIDPQKTRTSLATLLAPPGVLIGKYDASATTAQVMTALHHAGKCCDDPNCKHNHATAPSTQRPATSRKK